jgi:DEAD/DEAH box helicase domain-containing protein
MLESLKIHELYTHQAEAFDAAMDGQDIVMVTGTASGKTLCYQMRILELLSADPSGTVLLLFPTKALCQDQFSHFQQALDSAGMHDIAAGIIDGDTPASLRRKLRDAGRVIFSNPDMLHAAVLPHHGRWARFFAHLRIVVIDEMHVYNGIFGSNALQLFRRFFRICDHYGSVPRITACSATVGNPRETAERLFGRPLRLIDRDGSPRGRRWHVFWNPPRERERIYRSRRSANVEAHELMALLLRQKVPTIVFSKAKMTAELIHRYVTEALRADAGGLASRVAAYRGGYLPHERRDLEKRLFSGELLGVSTTNALELGIDVGGLDASIIVGYPGTLASYFQQAGRAGRAGRDSLSILVGLDTAVNQYVMSHPGYVFGRPVEQIVLDPDNPFILSGHLRCAVQELALRDSELALFGPYADLVLDILEHNLKIKHLNGVWYHAVNEIPHNDISLRAYAEENVTIEDSDTGKVIGELNKLDAPPLLHPEAIYLQQGETWRVLSLDLDRNIAKVKRIQTDYYTQPLGGTDVHHIDHCLREKPLGTGRAFWGEVTTYFGTYAYEKINFYTLDAIDRQGLNLPVFTLDTMAFWLVPSEDLMKRVRETGLDVHGGLRGIGYATRMVLPLFMTCDTHSFSHSIGSVNSPWNAIFVYERYRLGAGFTEKAFHRLHEIVPAVLDLLRNCACDDGCPCCVGKPLRGSTVWNVERGEGHIPSKKAALMILQGMIGDGSNLDSAETAELTGSEEARRERLRQALRRHLERHREPRVLHDIEPVVPTACPAAEKPSGLEQADPAVRAARRRAFDRELHKRIAQKIEIGKIPALAPPAKLPKGMRLRNVNQPGKFSPGHEAIVPDAKGSSSDMAADQTGVRKVIAGDSLAAKARRMKNKSKGAPGKG